MQRVTVLGDRKLEYSLPLASYPNVDVEGVAARVFSVSEEATKAKLIASTTRNIMPFLNSILCVVKYLSNPPLRS